MIIILKDDITKFPIHAIRIDRMTAFFIQSLIFVQCGLQVEQFFRTYVCTQKHDKKLSTLR